MIVWRVRESNEDKMSSWLGQLFGIEKAQRFIGLRKQLSVQGENLNQRYNFSYVHIDCENMYQS
jgi:hypothetical protein